MVVDAPAVHSAALCRLSRRLFDDGERGVCMYSAARCGVVRLRVCSLTQWRALGRRRPLRFVYSMLVRFRDRLRAYPGKKCRQQHLLNDEAESGGQNKRIVRSRPFVFVRHSTIHPDPSMYRLLSAHVGCSKSESDTCSLPGLQRCDCAYFPLFDCTLTPEPQPIRTPLRKSSDAYTLDICVTEYDNIPHIRLYAHCKPATVNPRPKM